MIPESARRKFATIFRERESRCSLGRDRKITNLRTSHHWNLHTHSLTHFLLLHWYPQHSQIVQPFPTVGIWNRSNGYLIRPHTTYLHSFDLCGCPNGRSPSCDFAKSPATLRFCLQELCSDHRWCSGSSECGSSGYTAAILTVVSYLQGTGRTRVGLGLFQTRRRWFP